jgi:hypothetical protein
MLRLQHNCSRSLLLLLLLLLLDEPLLPPLPAMLPCKGVLHSHLPKVVVIVVRT